MRHVDRVLHVTIQKETTLLSELDIFLAKPAELRRCACSLHASSTPATSDQARHEEIKEDISARRRVLRWELPRLEVTDSELHAQDDPGRKNDPDPIVASV
jgi:hypothetical protein